MKIDFDAIEEQEYPNFKGGEGSMFAKMYVDDSLRVINGRLNPGCSIGMHAHEGSCETIYILSGHGTMLYEGNREDMVPGSMSYCPNGHSHSLVNTGSEPLCFIGVVPTL